MKLVPARRAAAASILGLAIISASAFAGCSDDSGGGSDATAVTAAVAFISNAGLHDIDEELNTTGEVPATAESTARHIRTVILNTKWPGDLEDGADRVAKALEAFQASVATDNPDIPKAQGLANAAHDAWHDFEHDAWAWLESEAGIESEGGGSHN